MKFTLGTILFIIVSNILMAQRVVEIDELGNKVIGKMAPGFTGTTLDNLELDLAELRGKVVLLDFWSLSCAACFKELPDLNEIVKKYRNDKFILVSLMDNTREELVRKFEAKDGGYKMKNPVFGNDEIAFQIIPDAKDIMKLYSEQFAFSRAFIINQNGVVVNHFLGYADKRGVPDEQTTIDAMSQAISRLLEESR